MLTLGKSAGNVKWAKLPQKFFLDMEFFVGSSYLQFLDFVKHVYWTFFSGYSELCKGIKVSVKNCLRF